MKNEEQKLPLPVSYTHLDVYKRQVYALWTEDILPEGACAKEVRIDYRKAAMFKETIQVFVQQQEDIFKVKYIKPDGEIAALVEMTLKTIED